MAWTNFKLGRPGFEYTFEVPPQSMSIDDGGIAVRQRNLAGGMLKAMVSPHVPTIKINSTSLSLLQRNQFSSLASIEDSFLSFQCRNDFKVISQRLKPTATTFQIQLPPSSITRLSTALVAGGFSSSITITGIFLAKDETGANLYTGGSYADATRIITPGTPLAADTDVFVSYTYLGWLVDMQTFSHNAQGGWLDRFTYDTQLVGA